MGIFSKILLVIRSNINSLVDKAECPEKILDQLIADMNENLREVKLQVTRALKDEKILARKQEDNEKLAADYEAKAIKALEASDEELAREALRRKKTYEDIGAALAREVKEQQEQVELLRTSLKALELKIDEAKNKRHVLLARQKRAEARLDLSTSVTEANKTADLFETFERMADKILSTEAMASASLDMEKASLDDKFALLDKRASVDLELSALKKKLGK